MGEARSGLVLVMGAVGAVLLVLWVNLANLSLVRAAGRAPRGRHPHRIGRRTRRLLGSRSPRIMLLALAGGALGMALAYGGVCARCSRHAPDRPAALERSPGGSGACSRLRWPFRWWPVFCWASFRRCAAPAQLPSKP